MCQEFAQQFGKTLHGQPTGPETPTSKILYMTATKKSSNK